MNKSWRQHPARHQLYGHLPPIMKTIQVRRTRHAGHCWRRRDELISDVLLWTPTYGQAKAGRPARTYIQQLCEDTGCIPEDLPEVMNDREKWRERVRDICAGVTSWWWWWWSVKNLIVMCYIYIYIMLFFYNTPEWFQFGLKWNAIDIEKSKKIFYLCFVWKYIFSGNIKQMMMVWLTKMLAMFI